MGKLKKMSTSTMSFPSALVPEVSYQVPRPGEYSLFCSPCCSIHLRKAALIIGILDVLGQVAELYRNLELWILLAKCSNPMTSIVLFLMTAVFFIDVAVLVCFFAGIILNSVIFVIPMMFRYVFSIIFDSLFILYAITNFVFVDGTLKRPLIWIYTNLHECPSGSTSEITSSIKNEPISIQLQDPENFQEEELSKALGSTLFNLLWIFILQLFFQLWFLLILKKYSEFLYFDSLEKRRKSSSVRETLVS